ncbi:MULTISPECIES: hypothetical protein [unclassified Nocardiopsis]|uniref:hypothetical protein n=1 Tax=Nocardiopsis TaxID=2013 RepID=UPI00387B274B
MARYRYLNCSELVAARWLASEALRWRRPRKASRARMYTTHPGCDLAPLTLAVRQWISHATPPQTPTPAPVAPAPPPPLPRRVGNAASSGRPRVPEPRTSPERRPEPPTALSVSAPTSIADAVAKAVPGSGFTAALASRPRIQALRQGSRTRIHPRPGSPTAKSRAAARLRARTMAFRTTTHLTADRDGLWKDSLAAARILKWNLGKAA